MSNILNQSPSITFGYYALTNHPVWGTFNLGRNKTIFYHTHPHSYLLCATLQRKWGWCDCVLIFQLSIKNNAPPLINCNVCVRRGGTCFFQCMARGMLTSTEPQGLGSRLAEMSAWESRQGPPSRECLWIISPHDIHNKTDQ